LSHFSQKTACSLSHANQITLNRRINNEQRTSFINFEKVSFITPFNDKSADKVKTTTPLTLNASCEA
jgi:hypothetical protein